MSTRLLNYIKLIFDDVSLEEAADQFFAHKSGAAKTKFIYEVLKQKTVLPQISPNSKDDTASLNARNEGNAFFKQAEYVNALECYNKSLCLATGGSENLAVAYANRSMVYLKIGFYDFCLENIEMALKENFSEDLKTKLEWRRNKCKEMMKNNTTRVTKKVNSLSYEANNQIPIMIDGLELAKDDKFGRFIRSTRDLYPGDVIIIEEPLFKCIVAEDWFTRCANCLETNDLNLIPCLKCQKTMFCSPECQQEASKRFHHIECPIIDEIISNFDASPTVILAIRQTLRTLTMFSSIEELKKFISTIDVERESAFTLNYSPELSEKDHLKAIYAHTVNDFERSFIDVFKFTNSCAGVWNLLKNSSSLSSFLTSESEEDFFLDLIFRFLHTTAFNCHRFGDFGAGSFALCSLLNHSCAPNVERVVDGTTNHIVVRRFVKAGDQLFDNYGPNHRKTELSERQKILKDEYNFWCQCEACTNDYPLLEKMNAPLELYLEISEDKKLIKKGDEKFVRRKFEEYRKFLTKNYKKYPSYEICATEQNLMECLWALMFSQSLENRLKIKFC
ncbi:SET and MYND domain-containing protein 4-like [Culicoides brevitarsis]|uniref:SET and MYND domain-containing protein 4-like n=1 Tax=Culicoides brevitarsis TaxID=469753 RepID=UPI00307C9B2F